MPTALIRRGARYYLRRVVPLDLRDEYRRPRSPGADRITQQGYDAVGHRTLTIEAVATSEATTTSTATFGADGEQVTAADADGHLTTFVYDGFNRLSQIDFPDPVNVGQSSTAAAQVESYAYDAGSKLTQLTRRGGLVISYAYDALNRLTHETDPAVVGCADHYFAYDNFGRVKSAQAVQAAGGGGITVAYTYDAQGRVLSQAGPFGTVSSAWDAGGRRTRLGWPDGYYVTYDYDTTGSMTAIHENGGLALDAFTYDALGRRQTLTRSNGVKTTYGFNAAAELSSITHDLAGTAQDDVETFTYNLAGQVTGRTVSNDDWSWKNAMNVNRNYGSNGLNEQTQSGPDTLTWGAKGVLTQNIPSILLLEYQGVRR